LLTDLEKESDNSTNEDDDEDAGEELEFDESAFEQGDFDDPDFENIVDVFLIISFNFTFYYHNFLLTVDPM